MKKPFNNSEIQSAEPAAVDAENRRRSQRVVLRVALIVSAEMPDGKPVRVEAVSLVVNAHGGLFESTLTLAVNQKIVLVNPHTDKDVGCRVVRVEPSSEMVNTAFEFDEPTAKFWPVSFPPEDWEAIPS